jgi:photosystem II stability/assembly factor-like uncharacterized protein
MRPIALLAVVLLPASAAAPHVALVRLVSPSWGYVVTSSGSRTRLLAGDGRTWRDVTPPHVRFQPEDLAFLDRKHGWFATNDCAEGRATVDRTRDGGRTWAAAHVLPTNCAAGSALALSFLDQRTGWLVRTIENGPGAQLASTVDGGRTWSRSRDLPLIGRVAFRSRRDGWLGRSDFRALPNLFVTADGGRTWRPRTLPLPPGWRRAHALPDVPTFFGARGVLPITLFTSRRSAVAFYATSDGGRSWHVRSVRPVGFRTLLRSNPFPRYVPTAVASPTTWWVLSRIAVPRVLMTRDAGRHWRGSSPAGVSGVASARIEAAGGAAWLTLSTRRGRTQLLATQDAGRSWRPLRVPG